MADQLFSLPSCLYHGRVAKSIIIQELPRNANLYPKYLGIMGKDLNQRIQTLAQWLYESNYPVVFTGAGISTESGLPDFRGPDGLWTRQDKGLPPRPMAISWHDVEPNTGHLAIVELQRLGKLKFLISQNVDNLHLKSGIKPELLAELHGNIAKLRCINCGNLISRSEASKSCGCGGKLVKSVVDFGESLPEKDLRLSFEHSRIGLM